MADPAQELPDLPPRLDQAILDPLLTRDQLQALCDSGMQEGVRAICTTPRQLPLLRPSTSQVISIKPLKLTTV